MTNLENYKDEILKSEEPPECWYSKKFNLIHDCTNCKRCQLEFLIWSSERFMPLIVVNDD